MPNIVCLTDATAHGANIINPGVNSKVTYNGLLFATIGGSGPPHSPPHLIVLTNVIVSPMQTKVKINSIPVAVLGAICSCGDVVVGSPACPKITAS